MFVPSVPMCYEGDPSPHCQNSVNIPGNCQHTPTFGLNPPTVGSTLNNPSQTTVPTFYHPSGTVPLKPSSSCSIMLRTVSATLTSPDYPSFYPNSFDCTYRIVKFNSSVCDLLVKVSNY